MSSDFKLNIYVGIFVIACILSLLPWSLWCKAFLDSSSSRPPSQLSASMLLRAWPAKTLSVLFCNYLSFALDFELQDPSQRIHVFVFVVSGTHLVLNKYCWPNEKRALHKTTNKYENVENKTCIWILSPLSLKSSDSGKELSVVWF